MKRILLKAIMHIVIISENLLVTFLYCMRMVLLTLYSNTLYVYVSIAKIPPLNVNSLNLLYSNMHDDLVTPHTATIETAHRVA